MFQEMTVVYLLSFKVVNLKQKYHAHKLEGATIVRPTYNASFRFKKYLNDFIILPSMVIRPTLNNSI